MAGPRDDARASAARAAARTGALTLAACAAAAPAQDKGSINILCSVELEWCSPMSTTL